MIQDIATSIGEFDVSDEDYLFMKEFVANAVYDAVSYTHLDVYKRQKKESSH